MRSRWTVLPHAFAGLLLAASLGCGILDPESEWEELRRSLERWRAHRPAAYEYVVERHCFCGLEARGPARVTVEGGEVTERVYQVDGELDGEPVPEMLGDAFPSVDGLFEVIVDAIVRDAFRLEVTYDPVSGVPLEVDIDYEENVADEELGFRVVEPVTPIG